ncbi:MAG: hypothetical protein V1834_00760 [Candidatus Micrarchaeota archaeon]
MDIWFWISSLWWIWLLIVGWWWYSWAREHLAFSPVLALVIGGILVYYMVWEHPLIGSFTMIFWVTIASGVLFLFPMVWPLLFFWKK